jgi:hypothetical protein
MPARQRRGCSIIRNPGEVVATDVGVGRLAWGASSGVCAHAPGECGVNACPDGDNEVSYTGLGWSVVSVHDVLPIRVCLP